MDQTRRVCFCLSWSSFSWFSIMITMSLCWHKYVFLVHVHPCVCRFSLKRYILTILSLVTRSSQARQSDHLRDYLVYGLKLPVCPCMFLSSYCLPFNAPLQHTQNPQQPWPSPLIFSLLTVLLLIYHPCPLPPKGQGHEDKHGKEKEDERERTGMNHLNLTSAPGQLWREAS